MTSGSGEIVTYHLRVAKQIERKMICDVLMRLSRFEVLTEYRYVGFGSFYYPDFILFHRRLGIKDMHNIEGKADNRPRFEHNCPFDCINLHFRPSSIELPAVLSTSTKRTILWLDYDEPLDGNMLIDIDVACRGLASGSFLIVTANAEPDPVMTRESVLAARLPRDLLPHSKEIRNLGNWGTANFYRTLIDGQIKSTLRTVNQGLDVTDEMHYKQVLYFHYRDGARMMTLGGLLYRYSETDNYNKCRFDDLDYFQSDKTAFAIRIPRISYREQKYLDTLMPRTDFAGVDTRGIPVSECEEYARIYRYYPTYSDVDV